MAKQDLYTAPRKATEVAAQTIEEELNIPTAEERLKGVESWYQSNSKVINNFLIGFLAAVVGYFCYNKFMKEPKLQKANDAIFRAQNYFSMDSLNWALNGDGNSMGFVKIAKEYGSTPAGNLANYYAGVCFLKKGDFKQAEKYLKEFDGKGTMVEMVAKGALGDAYMEQNKTDDAIKAYTEASADDKNMLVSPIYAQRAAVAYEMKGNTAEAIKIYKRIKLLFPQSDAARNIDKDLARLGEYYSE
jgi:tetratricopeptide (TPR) repeat protein